MWGDEGNGVCFGHAGCRSHPRSRRLRRDHPLQLSALLNGHAHQVIHGDPDIPITAAPSVDIDRVAPGSLYLALPEHPEGGPEGIATDLVSARHHGEPGRDMDVVAVTGTNGKTSVASMYESLLRIAAGARVGVIGTSGARTGGDPIPMPRTLLSTPEAPDLQYLLARMRARGTRSVVLEATSTGLLQHRVDGSHIDVGIFTDLTQDHLDDHGTMENYRDAKPRLFHGLCRQAVINVGDPWAPPSRR